RKLNKHLREPIHRHPIDPAEAGPQAVRQRAHIHRAEHEAWEPLGGVPEAAAASGTGDLADAREGGGELQLGRGEVAEELREVLALAVAVGYWGCGVAQDGFGGEVRWGVQVEDRGDGGDKEGARGVVDAGGEGEEVDEAGEVRAEGGEGEVEVDGPGVVDDQCCALTERVVRGWREAEMGFSKIGFEEGDSAFGELEPEIGRIAAALLDFEAVVSTVEAEDVVYCWIVKKST
ncbi:MAG: hypothetical protein Q9157_003445, partial [Trypethelium eluteriae]